LVKAWESGTSAVEVVSSFSFFAAFVSLHFFFLSDHMHRRV
jgi:hypothetical protein